MASLAEVYKDLFTAPLEAAVEAEAEYRQIWLQWIERRVALAQVAGVTPDASWMAEMMSVAPAVKLNGKITATIRLRIEATRHIEGELGLALGPIPLTGSLGFSSERTEESTLEASAVTTLTNADKDLATFLTESGLSGSELTPANVTKALRGTAE